MRVLKYRCIVARRLKVSRSPAKASLATERPTPQATFKPASTGRSEPSTGKRRLKAQSKPVAGRQNGGPFTATEAYRIACGRSINVVGYSMSENRQAWCRSCFVEVSTKDNGYSKDFAGAGWARWLFETESRSKKETHTCVHCGTTFHGELDRVP